MSAGEGIHVPDIVFSAYLPENLPDAGQIRGAGAGLKAQGDKVDTVYSNTIGHWNRLPAAATYPNSSTVDNAFSTEILPLAEAVVAGIDGIRNATDAFAASLDDFGGRHATLFADVAAFNALPARVYSAEQQTEARDTGSYLPTTRTTPEHQRLIGLLATAKQDYEGFVDTCEAAIKASAPAAAAPSSGRAVVAVIKGFKNTYGMVNTNIDRATTIQSTRGGRLKLVWSMRERTLSQFAFDGAPNLKKFLLDGKLGPFSTPEFVGRHSDEFARWADAKYLKFTTGANTWADSVLHPGLMLMMPAALRGKLSALGGSNRINLGSDRLRLFRKSNSHGRTKFTLNIGGTGERGRHNKAIERIAKADGALDKFNKSPIAKWGGRGLGVLDTGMTYYDSYTSNYNEALRNNPDADPSDIRSEAVKSTAVEGTAETAGKIAGGVAGRALGAAAGQALIPIPGVGAAVGGFVGGIAGEWVGGKIGKGVGEFMNDWRQGGSSKAFGDAADAVGDAGAAAVDGLKDVGKSIGKKLLGWG